jgi:hypothetical protein
LIGTVDDLLFSGIFHWHFLGRTSAAWQTNREVRTPFLTERFGDRNIESRCGGAAYVTPARRAEKEFDGANVPTGDGFQLAPNRQAEIN